MFMTPKNKTDMVSAEAQMRSSMMKKPPSSKKN
jgi:hypothetical protein